MDEKMLEVKNLTVSINKKRVIDNVSFDIHPGQIMALVGESASGKTLTALSILDLLPKAAVREGGQILFKGRNILDLEFEEIRKIRGNDITMVFQEPFTALNPVMRVGDQIFETIAAHRDYSRAQVTERIRNLLSMVKLSSGIALRYPHELSGGMQQRIILAMALACDPDILILDEPTTALDVSIQKQILDLIKHIQRDIGFGALFITHDFSVVNMIADEVCVMRRGLVVEAGSKEEVLRNPHHEYTKHLIDCIPRLGDKRKRLPA